MSGEIAPTLLAYEGLFVLHYLGKRARKIGGEDKGAIERKRERKKERFLPQMANA